jgi:hypothetical protein
MVHEAVWLGLQQSRDSIDRLVGPARLGVYALFATPPDGLPVGDVPKTGLVYIGRSGNLAEREFDTHFSGEYGRGGMCS